MRSRDPQSTSKLVIARLLRVLPHIQVDVHNNLGDLWRAQGQVGKQAAQQCYSEALRIDRTYAPAWRGMGDVFREGNEHQQAVACYEVTICSQSHLAGAW